MRATPHPAGTASCRSWLAVLFLALSSCGGGGSDAPATAHPTGKSADLPLAVGTAGDRRHALTIGIPPSITAADLLDWAETRLPDLFGLRALVWPALQYEGETFYARAYGAGDSMRYLGVTREGRVYGLGDFTNGALQSYGGVQDWTAQVLAEQAPVSPGARFTQLGTGMSTQRAMHTATLLADGRVLITGGVATGSLPSAALSSAEIFDPASGRFSPLNARMNTPRAQHGATLLLDGRVLITGGQTTDNDGDGSRGAELYDPATGAFTALPGGMASPRGSHTATLLLDGQVLLAGGFNRGRGTLVSDAELFNPATGIFTALSARMVTLRGDGHTATLLPDGRVLIAGGKAADTDVVVNTAELYDPSRQGFSPAAASMTVARQGHTATLLSNGVVLLAGGGAINARQLQSSVVLNTAEVYVPGTNVFLPVGASMASARAFHAAAALPDGSVLLTGGGRTGASSTSWQVYESAELFTR